MGTVFSANSIISFANLTYFSSLQTINNNAFYWCYNLSKIKLPDSVSVILHDAFVRCYHLNITIGSKLARIDADAFYYINDIVMYITAAQPPTISTNGFRRAGFEAIYVPSESVNAYKSAAEWSDFASVIKAIPQE